ncbi:MAG TPA: UDP-N-acetylmuramoyl-L-alanine--D-glutamate ligase [Candidatus Saccharimonadales bacterium]|nr:UDP-N-acetylmuramoyl-L-alanine--D-glutamate ligase [Candidatus Saccharimonadales bacterium]
MSQPLSIAVLGYGVEGKSAVRYWQGRGDRVAVRDANTELKLPEAVTAKLGTDYLHNLDQYDLIVRSPGVRPQLIFEANPGLDPAKITSVTNQFLAECPAKVIGVTGTKGKGTTSTLIARMLEAAGPRVHLGGNIGRPALDFLADSEPEAWVVLELSSFQLMDVRSSPHIAVMLMIAPDHLDWHPDMTEYITAKQGIFKFQQPGDRAIYNACNLYSLQAGLGAPGDQMGYNDPAGAWVDGDQIKVGDTAICRTDEIGLLGRHNWDNVCAAITAVWPIIQDTAPIKQVVREFTGLEHRLERVAEVGGVTYINDSYSTNPEATIAALKALPQPKVVILGGSDKGTAFNHLAKAILQEQVRSVILVGATAPHLKAALDKAGYQKVQMGGDDMASIVKLAAAAAQPGDVALLSPACASFGLFASYKDRGEQFKREVHSL